MRHVARRLYFYLSWPGLKLYFARRACARVLITDGAQRVLLVQGRWKLWYGDNRWALPGGGVQAGETPRQAAARELAEELGVRFNGTGLRPLGQARITEYGIGFEAHLFHAVLAVTTPLTLQRQEIAGASWHDRAELAHQRLKPEVQRALQRLAETT